MGNGAQKGLRQHPQDGRPGIRIQVADSRGFSYLFALPAELGIELRWRLFPTFCNISPNAQGHDGEKERLTFLQFRDIYSENIY